MTFNLRAALFEDRYRRWVAPRLMLRSWLRYQLMRSRVSYMAAYRRSPHRKPIRKAVMEAVLLGARWRCLPFHYLRYGLYDRRYSFSDALTYLPETVLYYRLLPQVNRDTVLLDDKLVCKRILGDAAVPQAALLLSGDRYSCLDSAGEPMTDGGLGDHLTDGQVVVIKPARYSSGGDGVLVLTYSDGQLHDEVGQPVSLAAYGTTWGPWLVEHFIRQHQCLAKFNHRSLNTFRVITTWHPRDGAQVRYCVLKLGASTGLVDNAHDGGLYLRVDQVTGELDATAFDESFACHQSHPLSGLAFAGYKIERIREVVLLAKRSAALFPQTALIGWDIALGEQGPVIIEGNSSPGLTNVQRTHGGVAPTLGRYLAKAYASLIA